MQKQELVSFVMSVAMQAAALMIQELGLVERAGWMIPTRVET